MIPILTIPVQLKSTYIILVAEIISEPAFLKEIYLTMSHICTYNDLRYGIFARLPEYSKPVL